MKGQMNYPQPTYAPSPTQVYPANYTYPSGQTPPNQPKDIPAGVVIAGGLLLWVLLFGGVTAFAVASPCTAVSFMVRDTASLEKLEQRTNFDLSNSAQCRQFMQECVLRSCEDRMNSVAANEEA